MRPRLFTRTRARSSAGGRARRTLRRTAGTATTRDTTCRPMGRSPERSRPDRHQGKRRRVEREDEVSATGARNHEVVRLAPEHREPGLRLQAGTGVVVARDLRQSALGSRVGGERRVVVAAERVGVTGAEPTGVKAYQTDISLPKHDGSSIAVVASTVLRRCRERDRRDRGCRCKGIVRGRNERRKRPSRDVGVRSLRGDPLNPSKGGTAPAGEQTKRRAPTAAQAMRGVSLRMGLLPSGGARGYAAPRQMTTRTKWTCRGPRYAICQVSPACRRAERSPSPFSRRASSICAAMRSS